jgi:hypothetical protein
MLRFFEICLVKVKVMKKREGAGGDPPKEDGGNPPKDDTVRGEGKTGKK